MALVLPYPNKPATATHSMLPLYRRTLQRLLRQSSHLMDHKFRRLLFQAGSLALAANPIQRGLENFFDYVYSGGIVATVSGLNITISGGVFYIRGNRLVFVGVGSQALTASRDYYIDVDNLGNVTYQNVANGAAAPSLTANSIRIAKVVTGAAAVSSIQQYGEDSLNNTIYNQSPIGFNNWIDYSAVSTISGYSAFTNKVIKYLKVGRTAFIWFVLDGTSNSTILSFTLPFSQNPLTAAGVGVEANTGLAINNGGVQGSPARNYIDGSVSNSLVTVVPASGTGSWVASGSKGARGQFVMETQ